MSRTLRGRLTRALQAQLSRRLDTLELLALFLDGVVVGGQTVIVALGLTRDGQKVPLGLCLGSTENTVVCTEVLQDLLGRGLKLGERVLCVIDGGKGVRRALQDVLGTAAVIQRCQLHKMRNLLALVPPTRQGCAWGSSGGSAWLQRGVGVRGQRLSMEGYVKLNREAAAAQRGRAGRRSCCLRSLRLASAGGGVRRENLMKRCGISRESARRTLASLVELRLLRRLGTGRGAWYVLRTRDETGA